MEGGESSQCRMEQDEMDSRSASHPTDRNNLIINYLPDTMSQIDLQKMFESFGEIESCKLIKDKVSGHSLGYGFVKFTKHENAECALNNLDGLMLHHKKIKVSFARPANEPIKTANVYVCGLKNSITEAELISAFSFHGKVLTVKVMNNTGDSRKATAIGFVRFEKHQCAQKAIESLDQTRPFDNPSPIRVSFAKQSGKDPGQYEAPPSILALPHGHFGKHLLPLTISKLGKTPTFTGKSFRFDPLGKNAMRGSLGDGLYPEAMYQSPEPSGYVIFVFNLAGAVQEVHLWRLFGPYGAITDIKIVYDKETNKSKGFAFVTMPQYREAEAAIRGLNHTTLEGKILQVSFKRAKAK